MIIQFLENYWYFIICACCFVWVIYISVSTEGKGLVYCVNCKHRRIWAWEDGSHKTYRCEILLDKEGTPDSCGKRNKYHRCSHFSSKE